MKEQTPQSYKSQLSAFDKLGDTYMAAYSDNPNITESMVWLLERLPKNAHVLDVGCGTAQQTAGPVLKHGHQFTGIDSSANMLEKAQKLNQSGHFIQADFATLALDAKYDAIVSFFALLMLPRKQIIATLEQLASHLPQNGFLVLGMVEGDFDYIEIPFCNSTIWVTGFPTAVLKGIIEECSLKVLDTKAIAFAPEGGQKEVQQFFYCQKE